MRKESDKGVGEMDAATNYEHYNFDKGHLRHIEDVKIDMNLPREERVKSFIEQIGNPYCYMDGDVVVSLTFMEKGHSLREQLAALVHSMG